VEIRFAEAHGAENIHIYAADFIKA
jgi:hypothetical protein